MSGPNVVLCIPGDAYRWGQLTKVGQNTCMQSAKVYDGGALVCEVTVTWPAVLPTVPVVCHSEGRSDAAHD